MPLQGVQPALEHTSADHVGQLAFTAFVGANLLQSGFTRWCMLDNILRKLGARAGA